MFSEGKVVILESCASEKSLRINEANIFESLGSRTVPCPRGTSWSGGSTECAHTPLAGHISTADCQNGESCVFMWLSRPGCVEGEKGLAPT